MNFIPVDRFFEKGYSNTEKKAIAEYCKRNFRRGANYAYAFALRLHLVFVADNVVEMPAVLKNMLENVLNETDELSAQSILNKLKDNDTYKELTEDYFFFDYNYYGEDIDVAVDNGKLYFYVSNALSLAEECFISDKVVESIHNWLMNKSLDSRKLESVSEGRYGVPCFRIAVSDVSTVETIYDISSFGNASNLDETEVGNSLLRGCDKAMEDLLKDEAKLYKCPHLVDLNDIVSLLSCSDGYLYTVTMPLDFYNKHYQCLKEIGNIYEQIATNSAKSEFLDYLESNILGDALVAEYNGEFESLEKTFPKEYKEMSDRFIRKLSQEDFDSAVEELNNL